jgi:hypothetical protein
MTSSNLLSRIIIISIFIVILIDNIPLRPEVSFKIKLHYIDKQILVFLKIKLHYFDKQILVFLKIKLQNTDKQIIVCAPLALRLLGLCDFQPLWRAQESQNLFKSFQKDLYIAYVYAVGLYTQYNSIRYNTICHILFQRTEENAIQHTKDIRTYGRCSGSKSEAVIRLQFPSHVAIFTHGFPPPSFFIQHVPFWTLLCEPKQHKLTYFFNFQVCRNSLRSMKNGSGQLKKSGGMRPWWGAIKEVTNAYLSKDSDQVDNKWETACLEGKGWIEM